MVKQKPRVTRKLIVLHSTSIYWMSVMPKAWGKAYVFLLSKLQSCFLNSQRMFWKIYLCYTENTNSICQTLIKWVTVLVGLLLSQRCKNNLNWLPLSAFHPPGSFNPIQGSSQDLWCCQHLPSVSSPTHFLMWTLVPLHLGPGLGTGRSTNWWALWKGYKEHIPSLPPGEKLFTAATRWA